LWQAKFLCHGPYGKLDDKFCQIKVLNFLRAVPKSRNVRIKKTSGLIFFNPPRGRKIVFYIANMLLFGAFLYGIYLYLPLVTAIYRYKFTPVETKITNTINSRNDTGEYIISIPKILAYSKVIENVSPFDKAEYDRILKNNVVAQAKNTGKPGSGKGNSIYIFAHSTNNNLGMLRSNAVFYLLGELQKDDIIYLNYQQKELKYKIFDKKVAPPSDLSFLDYHDKNKEVLILQTCWPIGTDWNRLLVLAELLP
jgi:LPXTG-site transpeptidase (sortase) family protein